MIGGALERLRTGAEAILGRPISDNASSQFRIYLELLRKWQKTHRLVGADDPDWIVDHLFLDSLFFLRLLPPTLESLVDIGSGAGFPGYPLKIVTPGLALTLIESRRIRVSFLKTIARELELGKVTILEGRAETLVESVGPRFEAAVMRCAQRIGRGLPLGARFVRPGGIVIAAGPPEPGDPLIGNWEVVNGPTPGSERRFAVYQRS